jgi:hypothetical protein
MAVHVLLKTGLQYSEQFFALFRWQVLFVAIHVSRLCCFHSGSFPLAFLGTSFRMAGYPGTIGKGYAYLRDPPLGGT